MDKFLFFALLGLCLIISTCKDKDALPSLQVNAEVCDTIPATFDSSVVKIVNAHCATKDCHGDAGADGKFMRNYDEIKEVANSGEFVKAINHEQGADPMPKDAEKLKTEDILALECWILNNFPR